MANWSNPTLTSLYTDFLSELKGRDDDLAKQFDGTTSSNLATNTIRWNSTANRWQKWSGSAWVELTSTYALTGLSTTGNALIGGTLGVTGATTLAAATATTPATGDNSTAVATTAYVRAQAYAPLASPALTGTPTATTAAVDTNSTRIATTAFVVGQAGSTNPVMNGTVAVGASLRYSRQDHVHPSDTSRAPTASPAFTGTALLGTATALTNAYVIGTAITPAFQVEANTGNGAALSITRQTGAAANLLLQRGVTGTPVADTHALGQINFNGFDGANYFNAALIRAVVDGTPGTGSMPGRLSFQTTPTGSTTPVERLRLDPAGQILAASQGTAALPVWSFTGDPNTGVFSPGADQVAVATNGSERARIDSSGRLLVGTSSSLSVNSITAGIQLHSTATTNGASLSIARFNNDTSGPQLILGKSRNTTIAAGTIVQNNDDIGLIAFNGDNGTSLNTQAARIQAFVDGTPGATSMPGRLVFFTTADGASSPTERLRICEDGTQGYNQAAPVAVNATATLTIANLKTGIITSTTAAAVTGTLPTGTLTEGGFSGLYINFTFEWTVINTGATNAFTVAAGTAHTVVGNMVVAAGTSGRFASRRTAANTFVTYRLS